MAQVIFAIDSDGRVKHVSDVPSGIGCGCICIDCNEPLIARKGPIREHHFAHTSGNEHGWSLESHLHAYAKQLIIDSGGVGVPLHDGISPYFGFPSGLNGSCWIPAAGIGAIRQEISVGADPLAFSKPPETLVPAVHEATRQAPTP